MKNCKKGLSLLELTIGLLLLSGVALIYFQTVASSHKKNQFYSEHFMAALLAAKVVENCLQETDINPYGIEALGLADEDGKPFNFSTLITEGRTVFFQNPKITNESMPDLYNVVKKDFVLKVDTNNKNKNYFALRTAFDWDASTGSGDFGYNCLFPNYVMKKEATSTYAFPESILEQKVVERMLTEKDQTLGSIISSPTAIKVALATGRIYFSMVGMLSSAEFQSRCDEAQTIKAESNSYKSDRYAEGTERYFSIARDCLDLMLYLKPHIEYIAENSKSLDSEKLYYRAQLENYLFKTGQSLLKLQQLFFTCINEAASRYKNQIKASENLRVQRFYIERCFSMHRILYANKEFCDDVFLSGNPQNIIKSEYFDFLVTLGTFFESRDPTIFRLVQQEKKFAQSEVLKKRYFACNIISELFTSIEKLKKVLPKPITGGNIFKESVIGEEMGDGTLEGAITWARDQLEGGQKKGLNSNNGMTSVDKQAWNSWCLAFVNTAYGKKISELQTGSAVESMYEFKAKGKMKINKNPSAGAILFTDKTPTNPYGHIFIATGNHSDSGEPLVVTTGWPGYDGVHEITLSEMLAKIGPQYYRGWALPE